AAAGRRVAVNLGGVDLADLQRGDTLTVDGVLEATRRFDAIVELLSDAPPLKHGARVRVHHGTTELLGRIALAACVDDPAEACALVPGASAFARVADGRAERIASSLFSAPLVRALEARLLASVEEHHRAAPISEGLPREEARERVFGRAATELFDDVLARLTNAGKLVARDRLSLPGR